MKPRISISNQFKISLTVAAVSMIALAHTNADVVTVSVTNNSPIEGVYLTPVWVGFHNGSFDSYDAGAAASIQFSRLAEDGNSDPLAATFGQNRTLVATGVEQTGNRVQGTLAGANGVIAPGETVSMDFEVDNGVGGANQFLSFASMVLPSNDYFIANGDPTAMDLSDLACSDVMLEPTHVSDAGTEVNDFMHAAGNDLYPGLGLPQGQNGPNQGEDEFGISQRVLLPYAGFLNTPREADVLAAFAALNFNDIVGGVASISITNVVSVPEPLAAIPFLAMALGLAVRRKRSC